MENLKEYMIALTNLYGIVPIEKLVEIYNMQNGKELTEEDVLQYAYLKEHELEYDFVYIEENYFVHESFYAFDDSSMEDMLEIKGDKPYYIPEKQELLNYTDEWYFEKSKEYRFLYNYIRKNLLDDEDIVEEICEEIHGMLHVNAPMNLVMDIFNRYKISFDSEDQLQELVELIIDFSNNMRLWENNGYTPSEIFNKFEKPNLGPLPKNAFIIKKKKIGRNDPCPCGSGKKYKKCCIDK